MHTPNPEFQMPQAGRRRGRYSDEFKRQIIAAHNRDTLRPRAATTLAPVQTNSAFIPVQFESAPPANAVRQADIRLELQQGAATVHNHWLLSASSQCAQWLREVLT